MMARFVSVAAPRRYEGIGRALASAYPATEQAKLPRDLADLLHQLDRV